MPIFASRQCPDWVSFPAAGTTGTARRSGDCARKAAELTPGDLLRAAQAAEPAARPTDRGAEVSRGRSRSRRRQG